MRFKNFTFLILLSILCPLASYALSQPFELNGIYYCVEDETKATVCVTKPTNTNYKYYQGLVNIPANISYNGKTYSVVKIEREAFRGQSELTSVVIPKTLEVIEYRAFKGAGNLKTVAFSSAGVLSSIDYEAFDACRNLTSLTFPTSLKTIGDYAFRDCTGIKTINWGTVETLEKGVFQGCDNLLDITLPASVKTVGEMCFWNCNALRKFTSGPNVEYIGPDAFLDCKQLEEVSLNAGLKELGYEAFRGCWSLISIDIPDSVTKMGYGVFRYCVGMKSIKLSESLTEIPNLAFEGSDLQTVKLPNKTKIIGVSSFASCKQLESVQFGDQLEAIYDHAFMECSKLKSVVLPEPLKQIGLEAFNKCVNLEFASIPRTTYQISDRAFSECHKLRDVNDLATVPQEIYKRAIFVMSGGSAPVNVHVYKGLYNVYASTLGWYDIGDYSPNVKIIDDLEAVSIESIKFVDEVIYCLIGEQKKASVKIYPENAMPADFIWESSDDSVLFVDPVSGDLIGLDKGEATLKATVNDGRGISDSVRVVVTDDAGVESITVDEPKETIIYDLYGRRLNKLQKGINIVNGKKVLVM